MKYLVIAGCSHAIGTGLDYTIYNKKIFDTHEAREFREQNRWSKLLSNKLNLEEINISSDGGSNWNIYHNLMTWVFNNLDKINDSLFIISWTYADRNYLELIGDFYGPGDKLIYSSGDNHDNPIGYIPKELSEFNNKTFHEYVSKFDKIWDDGIIKTSLLYMTGLTSFLSNQNLKYLHFHSDFFVHKGPDGKMHVHESKKLSEYIAKYIDLFDTKNYIIDETYRWYCKSDMLIPPKYNFRDGHVGPVGQKLWADYLYKELQDRKIYG
jgi:hypothetical protein